MDLSFINAFTQSTYTILKDYLNLTSRKGKLQIRTQSATCKGMAIIIGITGDIKGNIIFNMKLDTGFRITERFNEEYIAEVNDLFISTMKEFGNIVCGNAMMSLENAQLDCDITPPGILLGEEMSFAEESDVEIIVVPFITDIGTINISVIKQKSE